MLEVIPFPINLRVIGAVLIVAALGGTHYFTYRAGQNNVRVQVAEQQRVEERARNLDRIRRVEQSMATEQKTVKAIERVRTVYRTIVKEIPVYVPADSPLLPAGFRLLHDAAAEGRPPAPPGSPDATPVAPADVAATVIDNYEACRVNAERLEGLQQWVREQTN